MRTVAEILDIYVADRSKIVVDGGGRIRRDCRPLKHHLGDVPIAEIDQTCIDVYVAARTCDGLKPSSVRAELVKLRAAVHMAHRQGFLSSVPSLILPAASKPRKRVLTPEEARKLTWEAQDQRLVRYILLGLATGGRREALLELTWDRIDFETRTVDLNAPHPRQARRKGRAVVLISKSIAARLQRFRPSEGSGKVIGLTMDQLHRKFREAATAAGLGKDVTPHTLRHTAATTMIRKVSLLIVSRMLGHANTMITEQVYIHTGPADFEPAAAALDDLFDSPKVTR